MNSPAPDGCLRGQIHHRISYCQASQGDSPVDIGCYQDSVKYNPPGHQENS